jgi:hypothetical protein
MGIVDNNIFTTGIRGAVDDKMVFRQVGKQTSVYVKRKRSKPATQAEQISKLRFNKAVGYAKAVLKDPAKKAIYAEIAKKNEKGTAYSAAVGDYMSAPNIFAINTATYRGIVGDQIIIDVLDDYIVPSVTVTISNPDGTVVETGAAVLSENNLVEWIYTAKIANANFVGDKVTAVATDMPGNVSVLEKTI